MSSERKDVLLALGWYHPQLHKGVLKFAEKHNWRVHSRMAFDGRLPQDWQGDGILFNSSYYQNIREFLERQSESKVALCDDHAQAYTAVNDDKREAVKLAVKHFTDRGFQNFAIFDSLHEGHNRRLRHFINELAKQQIQAHIIAPNSNMRYAEQKTFVTEVIRSLEKPLAVLAGDDNMAIELSYIIQDAGLSIPEDVAILGIHNDKLICESQSLSISSIDLNFEKIAFEAAKELHRLMTGGIDNKSQNFIPPAAVTARKSTDILVHEHPAVMKALHLIKQNYRSSVRVSDIAEDCEMSHRGLNKAFQKYLKRTVGEEILRLRFLEAKKLLKDTNKSIKQIALESGFGSQTNMYKLFQKELKITPSAYRKV